VRASLRVSMKALAAFRAIELYVSWIGVPPTHASGPRMPLLETIEVICGTDREIAAFEDGAPPHGDDKLVLVRE
jgi:hypothetical protein